MQFKLLVLPVCFVIIKAHPLSRDSSSGEISWDNSGQKANQANEKSEVTKELNGMWKSHVESSDIYSQDSYNLMSGDIRHKLRLESERLRARLRQQLSELRDKLYPHTSQTQHGLANVKELFAPLTKQLQSALDSTTQELCGQLQLHLLTLNPEEDALHFEISQRLSQSLDDSQKKMTVSVEDFKTKILDLAQENKHSSGSTFWEEVTSKLGQEASTFKLEVLGSVTALKASLADLLISPQYLKDEVTSRVIQFCQSSTIKNERLILDLEQHLVRLQQQHRNGESETHHLIGMDSLQDFSTKLNALLRDIRNTLY
ncbi:apolipoprotein A-IV [Chanos chanos]|uniref:Apolipoprotein A-IV-like n=1 Tax=Chanos chanos TaxID=29144 RepID=A0A6J2VJN7_CHACN|nr:apolipoprotein A-IV-like [Chanos chanos]XP_030632214.1 apolipoprotein A-IV-like [Chanos chanos]